MIWLILLPLDWLSTLLACLLAPVLPVFLQADNCYPRWLSWFQTPDCDAIGSSEPEFVAKYGDRSTWVRAVLWQWRNPAYGFAYSVLAAYIPACTPVKVRGNPDIRNTAPFNTGWCFFMSGGYWRLYIVLPSLPGRCLRVNMGWKITADGNNNPAQFVFSVNPFMSRP